MNSKQRRKAFRKVTAGMSDFQKQLYRGWLRIKWESRHPRPPLGHKDNPILISPRDLRMWESLGYTLIR